MRASVVMVGVCVVALGGCNGIDVTDTVLPTPSDEAPEPLADTSLPQDTGAPAGCVSVRALEPHHDQTDVFFRSPFRVDLDGDGRGVLDVRLVRDDGILVEAGITAWSEDGDRALVATPDPLIPDRRWRLRARTACSDRLSEFQTSMTGLPIPSGAIAPAWFRLQPEGLRSLLPRLDDHALAMAAESWSDLYLGLEDWSPVDRTYTLVMYGLASGPAEPTPCERRVPVAELAGWSLVDNPYLKLDVTGADAVLPLALAGPLGLGAMQLDIDGLDPRLPVALDRVVLSAALTTDRQRLDGLRLTLQADARKIATSLAAEGLRVSTDQLCNRAASLGASCQPCPDGRRACVVSDMDGFTAVRDGFDPVCDLSE